MPYTHTHNTTYTTNNTLHDGTRRYTCVKHGDSVLCTESTLPHYLYLHCHQSCRTTINELTTASIRCYTQYTHTALHKQPALHSTGNHRKSTAVVDRFAWSWIQTFLTDEWDTELVYSDIRPISNLRCPRPQRCAWYLGLPNGFPIIVVSPNILCRQDLLMVQSSLMKELYVHA